MLFRGRKSEPPVHSVASPPPTPSPKQYRSDTEIYHRYPELWGLKQFIALSASTFGNYAATELHESITNLGPEMLRQHAKEWKEEANAIGREYRALYESLRTASGEPLAGLDPNAEVLLAEV